MEIKTTLNFNKMEENGTYIPKETLERECERLNKEGLFDGFEIKHNEFEKLYLDYIKATWFLSSTHSDTPEWKALVEWSKEHKEEAVDGIIEILEKEPSDIVVLCDILFPGILTYEGYCSLDYVCNTWLVVLTAYKNGQVVDFDGQKEFPDHYKDYKEYHKYLEEHYIPWNPFHEDDPNITLEEFKQGKRNDENLLKEKQNN